MLENVDNFAETSIETAAAGPFHVFMSHQAVHDWTTPTPSLDSRAATAITSTPIDFNLDSLFTLEELDILTRQLGEIPNPIDSLQLHETCQVEKVGL
jgi:hypothetical protein